MKLILLQPTLGARETLTNLDTIEALVSKAVGQVTTEDVVLLPERFTFDDDAVAYETYIRKLATMAGCTVVGGSHHRRVNGKLVNIGCAADAQGNVLGTYAKLRPYFNEQNHVSPGDRFGDFQINGRNFLVLICADFWYSDIILKATKLPDVILVPSLSVSRKPKPEYSRSLWRHLAITRAYEFGVFIGISDWSEDSHLPKNRTCGVGGLADPTALNPNIFFQPISEEGVSIYSLNFEALEAFRQDRRQRGFFWR